MQCVKCDPDEQLQLLRPVPPIKLYCVIDIMFLLFNLCTVLSLAQRCVMSDNRPVVSLFGHSFVKSLCHWSGHRGELVVRTLGLQACAEVIAYGQGGLSFKRVLESPDRYLREIGHPDLLVIDLGSNDLTCVYTTVAEVADDALWFLALVDNDVHPKMIVILSVIQRTSVSNRGGMTVSTFNHRVKALNYRIAAYVRQIAEMHMFAQSRLNFPRYISDDGCHLTDI